MTDDDLDAPLGQNLTQKRRFALPVGIAALETFLKNYPDHKLAPQAFLRILIQLQLSSFRKLEAFGVPADRDLKCLRGGQYRLA